MDHNLHDETARAGTAGGKLKLSEIVRALRDNDFEADCADMFLAVSKDGSRTCFLDIGQLRTDNRQDMQLLQLFLGLPAIAIQHMSYEAEAMAAVAAAYGRSQQKQRMEACLEELREDLMGDAKAEDMAVHDVAEFLRQQLPETRVHEGTLEKTPADILI